MSAGVPLLELRNVSRVCGVGGLFNQKQVVALKDFSFALDADTPFIAAILAESGLSILGLGPQQDVTLGVMIYWALSYGALLQNLWWWWATPVMTLIVVFLALYLVHVGLD